MPTKLTKAQIDLIMETAISIRQQLYDPIETNGVFKTKQDQEGLVCITIKGTDENPIQPIDIILNMNNNAYVVGVLGMPLIIDMSLVGYSDWEKEDHIPSFNNIKDESYEIKKQRDETKEPEDFFKLLNYLTSSQSLGGYVELNEYADLFKQVSAKARGISKTISSKTEALLRDPRQEANFWHELIKSLSACIVSEKKLIWNQLAALGLRKDGKELMNFLTTTPAGVSVTKACLDEKDGMEKYYAMCKLVKRVAFYFVEIARNKLSEDILSMYQLFQECIPATWAMPLCNLAKNYMHMVDGNSTLKDKKNELSNKYFDGRLQAMLDKCKDIEAQKRQALTTPPAANFRHSENTFIKQQ